MHKVNFWDVHLVGLSCSQHILTFSGNLTCVGGQRHGQLLWAFAVERQHGQPLWAHKGVVLLSAHGCKLCRLLCQLWCRLLCR